jgi:hypothetical protein
LNTSISDLWNGLTIECYFAIRLAQAVLGFAAVLPEVFLGHVQDLKSHQAVVVGRGAFYNCANVFVISENEKLYLYSPALPHVLLSLIVSNTDSFCLISQNLTLATEAGCVQIGRGNKKIPLNFNEAEPFSIHFLCHKTSQSHENISTGI